MNICSNCKLKYMVLSVLLSSTLHVIKKISIFRKPRVKLVLMAPGNFDIAEHIYWYRWSLCSYPDHTRQGTTKKTKWSKMLDNAKGGIFLRQSLLNKLFIQLIDFPFCFFVNWELPLQEDRTHPLHQLHRWGWQFKSFPPETAYRNTKKLVFTQPMLK